MRQLLFILFSISLFLTRCFMSNSAHASSGQNDEKRSGRSLPGLRFTVSGDCVTDNQTRLMWSKDGNPVGKRSVKNMDTITAKEQLWCRRDGCVEGKRTWHEMQNWVTILNRRGGMCGYRDWRMPTFKELMSLVNRKQFNNARWLNSQGFSNIKPSWYWSATTYPLETECAWYIDMFDGLGSPINKTKHRMFILPVRSGQ